MKKNLQILGAGAQLSGKTNIFEGLYEYNLVFYDCGIKALVNSKLLADSGKKSMKSWRSCIQH